MLDPLWQNFLDPRMLMVARWKRADLLAFLYVMFSCFFFAFPYSVLGQVWYLIVSIPELCLLPYILVLGKKARD